MTEQQTQSKMMDTLISLMGKHFPNSSSATNQFPSKPDKCHYSSEWQSSWHSKKAFEVDDFGSQDDSATPSPSSFSVVPTYV